MSFTPLLGLLAPRDGLHLKVMRNLELSLHVNGRVRVHIFGELHDMFVALLLICRNFLSVELELHIIKTRTTADDRYEIA